MGMLLLGTLRALMLAGAVAAVPQDPQRQAALPELTIEELLGVTVQPVFGASERLQPVTEAPASVTIVTAAEIQRYGYRTLGDILRAVRGFVVTNDRNYSYAGVRGLSLPGDYNTRLLLLVNGHKINDNVYDQAYLGEELNLDTQMFERVEVIRGPSSSLYGTSAFFAVINVITRTGADVNGTWIDGSIGSLNTGMVRLTHGRELAGGVSFVLSGKHQVSDGVSRLYFDAFNAPATNNGIAQDLDAERVSTLYGQLKVRDVTFTLTTGQRRKVVPTASYYTLFNAHDPAEQTTDARTMLHGVWRRAFGGTALSADVPYDHLSYKGLYAYDGASVGSAQALATNYDFATGRRLGARLQATRGLPWRQTVTAGAEIYAHITQKQWNYYDDPLLGTKLSDRSARQTAVYVDDEMRVLPWLLLNGGLRHDRYAEFARTTPRAGVIVVPSPNHSFKY
ncbi:MAG: TonB-dependent receptor, partial [Acidobacteriota bacterium]|nr:TonB-dependent receptor [Acidobacteriota bacterium]